MSTYKDKQLLEDIYNLIKVCAVSDKQSDKWSSLSRVHADVAKKNLHSYLRNKNMEWDGDRKTIRIGKHIILQYKEE
jgi:hypothetical protein